MNKDITDIGWIERHPCTCNHLPQEHGLYGCLQRYLSDPGCPCNGVFRQIRIDAAVKVLVKEFEAVLAIEDAGAL